MTSPTSTRRINPSPRELSQFTLLLICSLLLFFSFPVLAAKTEAKEPSITAVIVDLTAGPNGQMQIFGSDFEDPEVNLGAVVLSPPHLLSEPGELIVALPAISPGDYKLTLRQGKNGAYQADYDLTIGSVGLEGPQGIQGPQGDIGPQGVPGSAGPQGADGTPGEQGPPGIQGPQGDVGPQGVPGSAGPQGDAGPQGIEGPPGPQGADGTPGEQGPQGIQGPPGADGADGTSATNSVMITVSSDQTVGQGGNMLGLGNQSGNFDDVALSSPVAGIMTRLAFTIKQNLGQGGVPIGPGVNESVDVFVVVAPYNSNPTYPNSYGTPKIILPALENFITAWELVNGSLPGCTGVATQTNIFPLDGEGVPFLPIGTQVGLKTVLDSTNKHFALCSGASLAVNPGDAFTAWVRPDGFTSFQPSISMIMATE